MADITIARVIHEIIYGFGIATVPKSVIKAADNDFVFF